MWHGKSCACPSIDHAMTKRYTMKSLFDIWYVSRRVGSSRNVIACGLWTWNYTAALFLAIM
jgi:hypothetical protein